MSDLLTSDSRGAARAASTRPPGPPQRPPGSLRRRRSRAFAGVLGALAAAAAGLLVVEAITMTCWIAETRTSAPLTVVLRTGAAFWLLGNGGRSHLPAGTAALIPLGLSILFFAFATRSGASVARARPAGRRRRTLLICAAAVGIPYALIAALVAALASGGGLRPSVLSALLGALVLAGAAAAVGAARELPMAVPRPSAPRAIASGVTVAAGVVVAFCAVLAAGMVLLHISDVDALARPVQAGAVGGFGLLTLQAALAPNAVVWTASYLMGPGFAVGAGTTVSPGGVHLGDVPALPMLAGLPAGAASWPFYVLFLVPPAAGVLGGVVAVRHMPRTPRLPVALMLGAGIAAAMALIALVAAALSGGPVTRGRLATVGPSAWQTAIAAGLEVGVPAVLATLSLTWYRQRAARLRAAAEAEPAQIPEKGDERSRRGRLRVRRPRLRHLDRPRRAAGVVLSAGRGLGTGLGLDRLRHGDAPDELAGLDGPEHLLVDLTKPSKDHFPVVSLIKTDPEFEPDVEDAPRRRLPHMRRPRLPKRPSLPRLIRKPRLPKRLRRKSKVIKLPD
ncbi:MAG TPA: DUF6350 family protein [Frankiaceae bacterium]|jgi:hypothetical protein|nr:DUF6350 family protein [Frankiaceae bacterium]